MKATNPLTTALLTTIDTAHERDVMIRELRKLLRGAVEMIAERDHTIARVENTNLHLQAQLRSAMSGRTVAAERQQIERDRLDAEIDARFERRHDRSVA